ncbi:uncharacterized protein LOC129320415 [Prosopis cineraria]|uniref:uncharacterized protein LOC129320415 n=1 Tax=Prosopis cineraria TaxID=364024 RepID=UPI0024102060|nr:uncharacterized protein LOC129320415 [Prosopis cineraria]
MNMDAQWERCATCTPLEDSSTPSSPSPHKHQPLCPQNLTVFFLFPSLTLESNTSHSQASSNPNLSIPMAKKRKSVATRLDEVDRTMYSTFCSAANSLSHLYTQAMNQQKLSFQAGERHSLEKLYQWILRQEEEGSRAATIDIVSYLKNELEYGTEESPMSPRLPFHQQQFQIAMHTNTISASIPSNALAAAVTGQAIRNGQPDQQGKNSVFSNALSSPIRRSLQPFQLAQGGSLSSNIMLSGNGNRNTEIGYLNNPNRDTNSSNSSDGMDMHADSPGHDFSY